MPSPAFRVLVDVNVVHDREQPCAQVAAGTPQPTLFPCARKRVLYEVIGAIDVAGENAGVTPQPRQRSDKLGVRQRIGHGHKRLGGAF